MKAESDSLDRMPRSDLVCLWRDCVGSKPPKGISRRLLVGAIAHAQQQREHGGLPDNVERRLSQLMAGEPIAAVAIKHALKPGTRLIREWNGVTYTVDVDPDGFVWNGERYGSLSAVAREITGARWSGPRFFGLNP